MGKSLFHLVKICNNFPQCLQVLYFISYTEHILNAWTNFSRDFSHTKTKKNVYSNYKYVPENLKFRVTATTFAQPQTFLFSSVWMFNTPGYSAAN
jgi:hypothetical protein